MAGLALVLRLAIGIPLEQRDGSGLQLIDALFDGFEAAMEMFINGAGMDVGQKFGAHEVGEIAGSVAGGDFLEFTVFVLSEAEDDHAVSGISGDTHHILQVLVVLTGAKSTSWAGNAKVLSNGDGRWNSWPRLRECLATLFRGQEASDARAGSGLRQN